jgi:hypothetical protein
MDAMTQVVDFCKLARVCVVLDNLLRLPQWLLCHKSSSVSAGCAQSIWLWGFYCLCRRLVSSGHVSHDS